jgi:hypothetical protein
MVALKRGEFTRLIMATPAAGQGMVNLIEQKEDEGVEGRLTRSCSLRCP